MKGEVKSNEPSISQIKLKRADQIQIFRFISFCLIYIYHANRWHFSFMPGVLGSQTGYFFFVVLSGVMASYSLYPKDIEPTFNNIFNYIKNRIIKVYSFYFITNLITVLYKIPVGLIQSQNYKDLFNMLLEFIATSLMLQTWIFKPFIYNAVTWYIATMTWLSILNIPFCFFAKKILKKKHPILSFSAIAIGGIFLSGLAVIFFSIMGLDLNNSGILQSPITILGYYITGMSTGFIIICIMHLNTKKCNAQIFSVLEFLALAFWLAVIYIPDRFSNELALLSLVVNIPLIIIFIIGHGKISQLLRLRALVHLGDISYEAFMIHLIVIDILSRINVLDEYSTLARAYSFAICFIITLCISDLLHRKVK